MLMLTINTFFAIILILFGCLGWIDIREKTIPEAGWYRIIGSTAKILLGSFLLVVTLVGVHTMPVS